MISELGQEKSTKKLIDWASSKLKIFALWKKNHKNLKASHRLGENYMNWYFSKTDM